jgi:alkylation response protein AidB-like acyl-CoA dehydrogenase
MLDILDGLLSAEQRELRDLVRRFTLRSITPHIDRWESEKHFPREALAGLAELGLCGVPTPAEWGGAGLGYLDYSIVIEELALGSSALAVTLAVTGLPQVILTRFGSDAQREKYLPDLAGGKTLGAFCLSEPGSGSDAAALRTTAVRKGDTYILEGTKRFITNGGEADVYVVMARTSAEKSKGISAFLVDKSMPGVSFGKPEEKMGWDSSRTVEVILENVEVPVENRIGEEGIGFTVAMTALDSGRITIAASAIGLSRAALGHALRYAAERRQFDQAIGDFQGIQWMLADMATRIATARAATRDAARMKDLGINITLAAAIAKLSATDAAMSVTTDAVQILGGNGYMKEYPVERLMREAKVMQIVEGTNQIQRSVIAREVRKSIG